MRRRSRRDRVTEDVWHDVVNRDAYLLWRAVGGEVPFEKWIRAVRVICVPRYLDPTIGDCSGGQTVDHVKDDLMMGVRAPSDHRHLVASCYYHNVLRPPTRLVRFRERQWLRRIYEGEGRVTLDQSVGP